MRVLVTGATGFAGSHLIDFMLATKPDVEVWGTRRTRSPLTNIQHVIDKIHLVDGDLTDPASVRRVLEIAQPDWVFHLAAQSYVASSFTEPRATLWTNITMEHNLLHGLREKLFRRLLVAGSSEEYGLVHPKECPITEDQPLRPLSPYGVSKVTQDLLAYQYHQSYGIHVVRTRAFNHEGPRRGEVFVTSNFAKQIAEIELGLRPPFLRHGNLDAVRDYTDVRDTVRAYWLALEKGVPGEVYNICSGHGWTIGEMMLNLMTQSSARIETLADKDRLRPSDVPLLLGTAARLHAATGWAPEIQFTTTLSDTLAYWRTRIARERRAALPDDGDHEMAQQPLSESEKAEVLEGQ